jgi:hypothetical protein
MAARLAAERAALPAVAREGRGTAPGGGDQEAGAGPPSDGAGLPPADGDDDDPAEIFDEPEAGGFYADAFEVLE